VSHIHRDGANQVLKDHAGCDPLFAALLGKLLTRREARALLKLDSVAGVPRLLGQSGSRALYMEWLDGISVKEALTQEIDWPTFLAELENTLREIHSQGVAHCDLRGLSNILVGPDQKPYVIDFVSCFFAGSRWSFLRSWVFRRFCEADRQALLKLRQRVAPESMNTADAESIEHSGVFNRAMRRVGQGIRKLSLWLLTRQSGSQSGR
jgi:predicted unusual protein kinase regulating ubiquinone biosynthesis (AarF/ABC1/UbiB family)